MLSASSLHACFEPLSFKQLDGWQKDDHLAAFNCFKVSANRMSKTPYETKSLGVSAIDLLAIGQKAITLNVQTPTEAKLFFEDNFCPYQYCDSSKTGFLTGYFEPEVSASKIKTAQYRYPIYRKPEDLVELNAKDEIITDRFKKTSRPGVFAAGDCTDIPFKQIIISGGEGAVAALSAFQFLSKI